MTLVSSVGSFAGIYLLTLNQNDDGPDTNPYLGYILVFIGAWLFGG